MCRQTFIQARENSLYHKLGDSAAVNAAVDLFYTKGLADNRIDQLFADINKQRRKQKEFLSAAFGGPIPYVGKDLRKAHAHLPNLNDSHFDAVAENLQKTLEEPKVPANLVSQVMGIAASTRIAVLNRPESAAAPSIRRTTTPTRTCLGSQDSGKPPDRPRTISTSPKSARARATLVR